MSHQVVYPPYLLLKTVKTHCEGKNLYALVGTLLRTVHTFTCTHTFSLYCMSVKSLGDRLLKSILDTEDY